MLAQKLNLTSDLLGILLRKSSWMNMINYGNYKTKGTGDNVLSRDGRCSQFRNIDFRIFFLSSLTA